MRRTKSKRLAVPDNGTASGGWLRRALDGDGQTGFGESEEGGETLEAVDDVGIELGAGVAADFLERVLDGQGRLVAAIRSDGIERIGDRQDASEERDVRSRPTVRIAIAVEPFVVAEHRLGDLGMHESVNHPETELGVTTNLVPLGALERTRLEEHGLVDVDLADVMKRASDAETTEALLAEIHPLPDGCGEIGHAGTMSCESWILGLETPNQSV